MYMHIHVHSRALKVFIYMCSYGYTGYPSRVEMQSFIGRSMKGNRSTLSYTESQSSVQTSFSDSNCWEGSRSKLAREWTYWRECCQICSSSEPLRKPVLTWRKIASPVRWEEGFLCCSVSVFTYLMLLTHQLNPDEVLQREEVPSNSV